jgi:hypothetical protein
MAVAQIVFSYNANVAKNNMTVAKIISSCNTNEAKTIEFCGDSRSRELVPKNL